MTLVSFRPVRSSSAAEILATSRAAREFLVARFRSLPRPHGEGNSACRQKDVCVHSGKVGWSHQPIFSEPPWNLRSVAPAHLPRRELLPHQEQTHFHPRRLLSWLLFLEDQSQGTTQGLGEGGLVASESESALRRSRN